MIAYIKGEILAVFDAKIVVASNDSVGYLVNVPGMPVPGVGERVELFVHTAVRQDDISLWGFVDLEQLRLFEKLLQVSGVGLKTGYALVAVVGVQQVVEAVQIGQADLLRAPGVGQKTAERIILELKDKLKSWNVGSSGSIDQSPMGKNDAVEALIGLGYKVQEIEKAFNSMPSGEYASTAELVRALLLQLR